MTTKEKREALNALQAQRTAAIKNINALKEKTDSYSQTANAFVLECRLELLESYFAKFGKIQDDIEHIDSNDNTRSEIEDVFIGAKANLRSLLSSAKESNTLSSTINPNLTHDTSHAYSNRLPKLKLLNFDGTYSEYKRFIECFNNLVDNDAAIPQIEKFNYLLNCLSGPALIVVESIQVTADNYKLALKRLQDRFDNPVLIFLDHISSLFNLQIMKKSDAVSLRKIIDTAAALRSSLLSLGNAINVMDAVVIHLVRTKLDDDSKNNYDVKQDFANLPSWDQFYKILDRRCLYLETQNKSTDFGQREQWNKQGTKRASHAFVTLKLNCASCNSNEHNLGSCPSFASLPVAQRFEFAKRNAHCINCLRHGHSVSKCQSKSRCRVCKQSHHTVLHIFSEKQTVSTPAESAPVSLVSRVAKCTLIPTAVILIKNIYGQFQPVRAVLDSGSEINFITEETAKRLNLKFTRASSEVSGIAELQSSFKHCVTATFKSRVTAFERTTQFFVTRSITPQQPGEFIKTDSWVIPQGITLADPQFFKPQKIDILISTEFFFESLLEGKISIGTNLPFLLNSEFGWIIGGKLNSFAQKRTFICNLSIQSSPTTIDKFLQKFWEIEEFSLVTSKFTGQEQDCEDHFTSNVQIESDGRLKVRLPFKQSPTVLGESYDMACKRFLSVEKRLNRDKSLKLMYQEFMLEYEQLNHMSPKNHFDFNTSYYIIPHHCVLRPQSETTKLRVVFDASARTTSNLSLNDILYVGPTIQQQLIVTLLSFRLHKYALMADISKMYRQFLIDQKDRKFQMVIWRNNPTESLQIYELNTVTYGLASSPFLAIRCLYYLADLHQDEFPIGACTLRSDLYVDDLLTGADNLDELHQKRLEINNIIQPHGLFFTKWNSNHSSFAFPEEVTIQLTEDRITKALGMSWRPNSDTFCFQFKFPIGEIATKRSVLSIVAKIYDVLGLLSPIIIRCKILLQEIWLQNLDWDIVLPPRLYEMWNTISDDLVNINKIEIPRYVFTTPQLACEVHGFADASERAYGCCIYIRAKHNNNYLVNLLIAKSKVAPIKAQSVPRLELCAAVLLCRTWNKIKEKLAFTSKIYFWTDSKTVLQWLKMHSSMLNCFVANRISEIQTEAENITWKYVPSKVNPADIVSRGHSASDLPNTIWFTGPNFLQDEEKGWPTLKIEQSSKVADLEHRKPVVLFCEDQSSNTSVIASIVKNNSSYWRIIRIISYLFRIINKIPAIRTIQVADILHIPSNEIDTTLIKIIADIQKTHFKTEFTNLNKGKNLSPVLQKLSPFIDSTNSAVQVLRVGGRLAHADIPYEAKFPALMPKDHRFTQLYLEFLHRKHLHAGPKVLLSILRQKIWIINGREAVRKVVRNCIQCFHYKPKLMEQIMGNLPANRLRAERPFLVTGIDFCGPFFVTYRIRGKQPYKVYAAVFVCFASKAVHIETVSDLYTNNFLLSLKRFIARRGIPKQIFCDNATNFIGASNKLQEFKKRFLEADSLNCISHFSSVAGFEFKFIPARAPHFGGLWEAAVKAAKTILLKNASQAGLTLEELQTLLIEAESILNSRPITAISEDPSDGEVLTPAHLLIGERLTAAPDDIIVNTNTNYLTRWQRVTYLKQQFWKIWQRDYILDLQQRAKWRSTKPNIKIGDLVVVHDDNLPPRQWLLARVTQAISGADGRVRVVDLHTTKGSIRRPIQKVAPLPFNNLL